MDDNKFDESRVISTYPVIVIGAGLGGLGVACQLVLKGEKVLILENLTLLLISTWI